MKFYEQFNKYMEEADVESISPAQDADNQLREEGYKLLEDALHKFYEYGYTGSSDADAAATNERVAEILRHLEVDDRDMQRFADVLTSIVLGQMVRGHADF